MTSFRRAEGSLTGLEVAVQDVKGVYVRERAHNLSGVEDGPRQRIRAFEQIRVHVAPLHEVEKHAEVVLCLEGARQPTDERVVQQGEGLLFSEDGVDLAAERARGVRAHRAEGRSACTSGASTASQCG